MMLFKYFLYTIFIPLWLLQKLIPRKNKVWVFGAWGGKKFSDNTKYLFLYVTTNRQDIKAVWVTHDTNVFTELKVNGYNVELINSFRGIFYTLIAKHIFVCWGKDDIPKLFTNGAVITQMWHGNPLKKIGLDDKLICNDNKYKKALKSVLFPYMHEYNYKYVGSNSKYFTPIMSSAFAVSEDKVIQSGSPRNDAFYSKIVDKITLKLRHQYSGAKIIYYLPTFRSKNVNKTFFDLNDFNEELFNNFLVEYNLVFVYKGHFVDKSLGISKNIQGSRILNLNDSDISDINLLLKDADFLITDYSGAYFDFLITEKPIFFAAFDLELYLAESRELYLNYNESIAGPIVKNWTELINELKASLAFDSYKMIRHNKNAFFNQYRDNHNSKRFFEIYSELENV